VRCVGGRCAVRCRSPICAVLPLASSLDTLCGCMVKLNPYIFQIVGSSSIYLGSPLKSTAASETGGEGEAAGEKMGLILAKLWSLFGNEGEASEAVHCCQKTPR
jgi:hypothetical protein